MRDERTLQVGQSAVRKPLFLPDEKEEPWQLVMRKMLKMEIAMAEENVKMKKRLEALEEEQLGYFLRSMTEKWLTLFGGSLCTQINDVKALLRQRETTLEKKLKLNSTRGSFKDIQKTNLWLKELDAKLAVLRKKITEQKVLGLEDASSARQLETLIESYLHVNHKAHPSISSERWKKCEANAMELVERGELVIEGVNVGSLVKLMLENLKAPKVA